MRMILRSVALAVVLLLLPFMAQADTGAGGKSAVNQRLVITGDEAVELRRLLETGTPWVATARGARPLYILSFRDCTPCNRFKAAYLPDLVGRGVEPRVFLFLPGQGNMFFASAAEFAVLAELHRTRDPVLHKAWFAPGTSAENVMERFAISIPPDEARRAARRALAMYNRLKAPLEAAAAQGLGVPVFLWAEGDTIVGLVGSSAETARLIREGLGRSE